MRCSKIWRKTPKSIDVAAKAVATTLSDSAQQTMLEVEALQWLALQAELGLYLNAPIADINERLRATQLALAQYGEGLALPVALDTTTSAAWLWHSSVTSVRQRLHDHRHRRSLLLQTQEKMRRFP